MENKVTWNFKQKFEIEQTASKLKLTENFESTTKLKAKK